MFQNIPKITKNLLVINILAYLATVVLETKGINLNAWGGLHFFLDYNFHFYQFVTYLFLHGSFMHLFFNMFALWMFGCVIERVWGPKKFLIYYLVCGIGAGLCQEVVQLMLGSYSLTIGASGSIYAILLAFGMTFPEERIFIFPLPIPIKAKWFVALYAGIELYSAVNSSADGVAHMAHLGGMLFGLILILYWQRHPDRDFDLGSGQQFFQNMKNHFDRRKDNSDMHIHHNNTQERPRQDAHESDWEYNAHKAQRQAEVDAILDKIRKSGYDSLTKEEKNRLFEASQEK